MKKTFDSAEMMKTPEFGELFSIVSECGQDLTWESFARVRRAVFCFIDELSESHGRKYSKSAGFFLLNEIHIDDVPLVFWWDLKCASDFECFYHGPAN